MSTTNSLFFSIEEAAREVNLRPIELLWAYSSGAIKGQRVQTVPRFVDGIRFTSDQIVSAVQSGRIYTEAESHLPFAGGDDTPWPDDFAQIEKPSDRPELRRLLETKSSQAISEEKAKELFVLENQDAAVSSMVSGQDQYSVPNINKAVANVELTLRNTNLDEKADLTSPYGRIIVGMILYHLRRNIWPTVLDRDFFATPGAYRYPAGSGNGGNMLIWLCVNNPASC